MQQQSVTTEQFYNNFPDEFNAVYDLYDEQGVVGDFQFLGKIRFDGGTIQEIDTSLIEGKLVIAAKINDQNFLTTTLPLG